MTSLLTDQHVEELDALRRHDLPAPRSRVERFALYVGLRLLLWSARRRSRAAVAATERRPLTEVPRATGGALDEADYARLLTYLAPR